MVHQWNEIKRRRETSSGFRFPGYLASEDLRLKATSMGVRLSALEAREMAMLVAPEKSGKITQSDLQLFTSRSCRMFGELDAILERDLLKPLITAYSAHRDFIRANRTLNPALAERYDSIFKDIVRQVQGAMVASTAVIDSAVGGNMTAATGAAAATALTVSRSGGVLHDVVSISQLKGGIEAAMRYVEFSV